MCADDSALARAWHRKALGKRDFEHQYSIIRGSESTVPEAANTGSFCPPLRFAVRNQAPCRQPSSNHLFVLPRSAWLHQAMNSM